MSFPTAPTQQQPINGFGTAVASSALAPTAANSLIVVEITSQITTGTSVSVTDNIGNTYLMAPLTNPGASQRHVEHWYCLSAIAGVTAVTVNNTASANVGGTVTEWAGGASSLRSSASLNNASSTNPPAATVTPVVGDLIVSSLGYVAAVASTRQETLTGAFTALTPITRGTTTMHAGAYLIATSTTATGATWAMSPTVSTGEATSAFVPAAVAGGAATVSAVAATATAAESVPSVTSTTTVSGGSAGAASAVMRPAAVTGSGTLTGAVTTGAAAASAQVIAPTVTGAPGGTLAYLVEIDLANTGTYTDITKYVRSLSISRGRTSPTDSVSPGKLSMVLENNDFRFTPGKTTGAYYPNIKLNRSIRVSVATGAGRSYLITAKVDSWNVSWEGGQLSVCNVVATDGFKGLARRVSQSLYLETVLNTAGMNCLAVFPLSESASSTGFGDVAPGSNYPPAQAVSSKYGPGTFSSGNGAGFLQGAPQSGYVTFESLDPPFWQGRTRDPAAPIAMSVIQVAGGKVAGGAVPPPSGPWTVGCWFQISKPVSVQDYVLLYIRARNQADPVSVDSRPGITMSMTSGGQVRAIVQDNVTSVDFTSTASFDDGAWHYATISLAADQRTVTLFIDGGATQSIAPTALAPVNYSWFVAGGRLSYYGEAWFGMKGSLAFIEVYSDVDSVLKHTIRWLYGRDGHYLANSTDAMFVNVAKNFGYNQFAAPFVIADPGVTTQVAEFDTTGMTFLAALQMAVDTEQGVMFMSGNGVLRFKSRSYRVNQASAFTLDNKTGDVQADFQTGIDDSLLFNDFAATRPGGATIRVRDTTTSSVADNGVYTNSDGNASVEMVNVTTDNEVIDYANYKVAMYSQPQLRTPQIVVDLASGPILWATVQAVEIGTRFTIANLPAEAPSATMDFTAESVNWDINPAAGTAQLTMDTSPAERQSYLTLDDAKYGLLDSNALFY